MNKSINMARVFTLVVVTLITSLAISSSSFAQTTLTEEDENKWSQNNITFYDPCPTGKEKENKEVCGSNKNYAGDQVFTDEQMEAIKANRQFYESAASTYGFPWQIIAVIHKREHNLARSNPDNGQGVYQFASAERRASCKGGDFTPGQISDEQFQVQTNCVADAIKNSYGSGLDLKTDEGIKRMFFKYNGEAQSYINQAKNLGFSDQEANNGEGSPYVMNRYDAKREPSSTWGQIKTDGGPIEYPANSDFGAFVYYKAITCDGEVDSADDSGGSEGASGFSDNIGDGGGASDSTGGLDGSSSSSGGGSNAEKIASTAVSLAWPEDGPHTTKPTEALEAAWAELGTSGQKADCGYFVQTVVTYSGVDSEYNELTKGETVFGKFEDYVHEHPEKWDVIDFSDGDTSKLQSGDIIMGHEHNGSYAYHTWVIAEIDGKLHEVEASHSLQKYGRVTGPVEEKSDYYDKQTIARAKGGKNCDSCEKGSMNVNGSAACLAWPLGTDEAKYTLGQGQVLESMLTSPGQTDTFPNTGAPTKNAQKAWVETNMIGAGGEDELHDGGYPWRYGAYCSGFAALAVRWSGVDPHFSDSQPGQLNYALNHTDIWDIIKWSGKKEDLRGGDVLDKEGGHTWMVVEDQSGEMYVAEASLGGHLFGHITEYYKPYTKDVWIFRAKNAKNSNVGVSVKDGVTSSSTTGKISEAGKGNGDIGASALDLAWPDTTGDFEKKPTDKFLNFFKGLDQAKKDKGNCYENGKSCDRFAATAIRYSGVDEKISFGPVSDMLSYVEKSEDWERVNMTDPKKLDDYRSGDLVFFYIGDSPTHVGIYAIDSGGVGHVVQASHCEYFGVVKDTTNITDSSYFTGTREVFRNVNNKDNSKDKDDCDLCPTDSDDSSDSEEGGGQLKDGGFTSKEEAEKTVIGAYKKYNGDPVSDFGTKQCNNSRDNCSTFSLWFLKTYVGWNAKLGGDGKSIADNVYNAYHSKYSEMTRSSTPSVYSIASWSSPVGDFGSSNHTGVIVGINESKNEILIADAAWCTSEGRVVSKKLSDFKGHGTYVSLAPYIKGLAK